jgi:hypothetical protein
LDAGRVGQVREIARNLLGARRQVIRAIRLALFDAYGARQIRWECVGELLKGLSLPDGAGCPTNNPCKNDLHQGVIWVRGDHKEDALGNVLAVYGGRRFEPNQGQQAQDGHSGGHHTEDAELLGREVMKRRGKASTGDHEPETV